MATLVYIRHGDKQHHNHARGVDYAYDSALSRKDLKQMQELVRELVKEHGTPTQIICSPFERCRETALILRLFLGYEEADVDDLEDIADEIQDTRIPEPYAEESPTVEIKVDRYIGEYFGNLDTVDMSEIRSETHPESIFVDRNTNGLKVRVNKHLRYMSSHVREDDVIWLITHGSVISAISKSIQRTVGITRRHTPTLGHIVVPQHALI